jgi:hypothetical protein
LVKNVQTGEAQVRKLLAQHHLPLDTIQRLRPP